MSSSCFAETQDPEEWLGLHWGAGPRESRIYMGRGKPGSSISHQMLEGTPGVALTARPGPGGVSCMRKALRKRRGLRGLPHLVALHHQQPVGRLTLLESPLPHVHPLALQIQEDSLIVFIPTGRTPSPLSLDPDVLHVAAFPKRHELRERGQSSSSRGHLVIGLSQSRALVLPAGDAGPRDVRASWEQCPHQ